MVVALITTSPYAIVATYGSVPNPLPLPNGTEVFGATVGWNSGIYKIVNVTSFVPPSGYVITGSATYSIDGSGNVTQTYDTIPTPPYQVAAGLIASGLAVTSVSTPSLNATYAIDPATQQEIIAVNAYTLEYGTFPDSATSLPWPDMTGTLHTFPSVVEFQAFAKTVADYVAAVELTANILASGGSASWPADATIP